MGRSRQRVVSTESFLKQPLDCGTQASSYYVCYGLEGGGRVYFSKNSLRDLVDLVITSVTVLLASLVYHLDEFGGKPSGQILTKDQPNKCFDHYFPKLLIEFVR